MATHEASEALRLKKVTVDFEGSIHHYRIVPNYTFANLLTDSTKHWMVDEDDYELQDEDGCTWPAAGIVIDVLLAEKALEDFPQSSDLQVYLKPLETFGNRQSPRYVNPPPSLISSYSSTGSSYGGSSYMYSSAAMAIPKPSSSPLSRSSGHSQVYHQRTPSKSDAVRKLIEENRLAPPVISSPLSSSVSIDRSHLSDSSLSFPDTSSDLSQNYSISESDLRQLSREASNVDSAASTLNRSTSAEDLRHLPLHSSALSFGSLQSSTQTPSRPQPEAKAPNLATVPEGFGARHPHPPILAEAFRDGKAPQASYDGDQRPEVGSTSVHTQPSAHSTQQSHSNSSAPSLSSSTTTPPRHGTNSPAHISNLLSLPPIQHGYARRGCTTELSIGDILSSTSSHEPNHGSKSGSAEKDSKSPHSQGETTSVPTPGSPSRGQNAKLDSARTSAAGIRLRKAYDNVTVNEVLSDPRIQLAPTTHKDVTLEWDSPPTTVLIIKKRQEPGITELLRAMAIWLQEEKKIKVLIEPSVATELPELTPFCSDDPARYPDIVICLGGDGTVLHANTLFQNSMPPLMAFSLGSLGFLTPFRVRKYKQSISGVLNECKVTLRSRLFCIVVKHVDGKETVTRRTVLNEVVVDRGYSPYLSNLECYCDNVPITNIQADGIIISSTTGSTAYSLSAGGSMVHPQMPAILFTPICPHSLSFRPLIFPDSVELKIQVPDDSRSTAWASFDGREQTELHRGDYLIIRVSKWPFVWIRESDGVGDWFKSLADCLHWNDRRKQKPPSTLNLTPVGLHSARDPSPAPSSSNEPSS